MEFIFYTLICLLILAADYIYVKLFIERKLSKSDGVFIIKNNEDSENFEIGVSFNNDIQNLPNKKYVIMKVENNKK